MLKSCVFHGIRVPLIYATKLRKIFGTAKHLSHYFSKTFI